MAARLLWVYDSITDAFKAPFSVALDNDYYSDLQKRYRAFFDGCRDAGADELSLKIIDKYSRKVLEALRKYYSGRVSSAHMIIKNLVKGCLSDGLAISSVTGCQAFSGATDEIQFFRALRHSAGFCGSRHAPPPLFEEVPYGKLSVQHSWCSEPVSCQQLVWLLDRAGTAVRPRFQRLSRPG